MSEKLVEEPIALESLVGQVADEFLRRQERGERPDVEEYAARYPQAGAVLRKVLAALELLEQSLAQSAVAAGTSSEAPVTGVLGDFRLLREVGRGGMGVVYEAEQVSLGRRVALKVLPFAAALDAKQLQRFKNEAQAAAHLQHPHIVPVHSVGCERGVHFYAMQLIDGHTLAAVIAELRRLVRPQTSEPSEAVGKASAWAEELASGRWAPAQDSPSAGPPTGPYLPAPGEPSALTTIRPVAALSTDRSTTSPAFFRTVANLGVQAAEALEHAHQVGVIHRDIKPANLLVDAGGSLWVTDFGLARLGTEAGLTLTGDLLGTLRYMSPEQALAKRVAVDARTDVYSLGVTLYELLALEPAYDGRNREEVLRQIAFEEPRPPRRLNRAIPAELETIVLKAMAKNPEERYATAQELADDLRRFLDDQPIRAKRPSLRQRVTKWARRHQSVVRAGLVVLVLAVFGLSGSTWLIWRSFERERQDGYYQRIALAEREWSANNLGRMQQLLDECPADLRGWEWHYLRRLRYKTLAPFRHDGAVLDASFSPDGWRIASACQDGIVKVWDAQTGLALLTFQAHASNASGVAFSPDGRRLATIGRMERVVQVWDAQTGDRILTLSKPKGMASRVAFSPDGRHLACAGIREGEFGEVTLWDAITGQEVYTRVGHTGPVADVTFRADGKTFASAGHDGTVRVWEAATGQERLTFCGHRAQVQKIAFSPDGQRLASAAGDITTRADGEVKVWEAQTGREVLTLRGHVGPVLSVAWSPDSRRLATGGFDQTVKIWDLATGREALTLRGHADLWISVVAFSPDGNRLLSGSLDRTVRVWDATPLGEEAGEEYLTFHGHRAGVRCLAYRPDGCYLASAGDDKVVLIWDAQTGRELRQLAGDTGVVTSLAFSCRGERLALGTQRLKVWDTTTWQELVVLTGLRHAVSFSRDDRYLASSGIDYSVKLLNRTTHQVLRTLRDHHWGIFALAFSPDSCTLASASADGSVRLWDVATGEEIPAPRLRHPGVITSVAWRPDGRRLVSAGQDGTVTVWDTASWQEVRTFHGTSAVLSAAWSPDGRRLAWGSTNATIQVADPASGAILRTLRGHTSWVTGVAFSPDGLWIASASLDRTVKIWKAPRAVEGPQPEADDSGK
jgi:WD40 repeat protein/serine/threonine protein kinase